MKKSLLIFAVLVCLLFTGCAKKQQAGNPESPVSQSNVQAPPEQNTEAGADENKQESTPAAPLAPSKNTEVVTDEKAPKVYWAMDIAYHLENCNTLEDAEPQEVPWSLVKEIGLRQCPECNPPRYEGYVTAD